MAPENTRRILIVDDDPTIRQMMTSLLRNAAHNETSTTKLARRRIFKNVEPDDNDDPPPVQYLIDTADQGQKALALVQEAVASANPYLMVFLDMRMPPGWDGVETMIRLWEADEHLQIALCTAYSDYSWEDIISRTGRRQNLLILKKPFDYAEAAQMALALSEKGLLTRKTSDRMQTLERMVADRTSLLEDSNRRLSSEIVEKEHAREETVELLETTLNSIAGVLISLIEMGNPLAFSHAKRIKAHTTMLADKLGLSNTWSYELAAVLSQLGCATIPEGTLRRYFSGADISFEERSMLLAYPTVSAELIAKIPKLDSIAAMMGFRDKLGDASTIDFATVGPVEAGAWILRTSIDFDVLLSRHNKSETIAVMRNSPSEYPKMLLDLLEECIPDEAPRHGSISTIAVLSLDKEMVLNQDIIARDGTVVARKDQRMSEPLLKRIRNFIQADLIESEIVEIISPKSSLNELEIQ
jgi:response regulator RpfG family c-di-GMP phosphodiesterase